LDQKNKLRVIAALLIATFTFVTPLPSASAAQPDYASSLAFLSNKFVAGKALDGFSPGVPDFGFTLEAMLQRKALGQKLLTQIAAVKANLADTTIFSKSAVSNYAYSPSSTSKNIKPGLAGKFLFTSAALAVPNAPLRNGVLSDLKKAISANGVIASANDNSFEYSWVILGLASNKQTKLANLVAQRFLLLAHSDGGFGPDQTGNTKTSSTDATGIALQALAFAKRTATIAQISKLQKTLVSGSAYLRANLVKGDHWESSGEFDVNGTAYAAMGLKAAGGNVAPIQAWLVTQIATTGGLLTPWSNGVGDVFASAQGMTAVLGLSYLNLYSK
jgi:hypothetical protein